MVQNHPKISILVVDQMGSVLCSKVSATKAPVLSHPGDKQARGWKHAPAPITPDDANAAVQLPSPPVAQPLIEPRALPGSQIAAWV